MSTICRTNQNVQQRQKNNRMVQEQDNPFIGRFGMGYLQYPLNCVICGDIISPAKPNQKYCEKCGIIRAKERSKINNAKGIERIAKIKANPILYEEYKRKNRERANKLNRKKGGVCECGRSIIYGSTMCHYCASKKTWEKFRSKNLNFK